MDQYNEIKLKIGSTIDEAVEKLLACKEKGELAYVNFNGIRLYSDNITMDKAYLLITRMTRSEFHNKYGLRKGV